MTRRIEGEVLNLQCTGCAARFPSFQFSGDTDMATAGLASATCSTNNEVALGEMSLAEAQDHDLGAHQFAKRMSEQLHRAFQAVRLIRVERGSPTATNLGFQDFRRSYVPPKLVFGCPMCGGDAVEIAKQSPAEFQTEGGRLTLVGDVHIAE